MTTRVTYSLEAFTLDRKRVWDLNVFFDRGSYRPDSDIINFRGPISYYVEDLLFLQDPAESELSIEDWYLFAIDYQGRTFGLNGTGVYVYSHKVQGIVEEHQKSLIR